MIVRSASDHKEKQLRRLKAGATCKPSMISRPRKLPLPGKAFRKIVTKLYSRRIKQAFKDFYDSGMKQVTIVCDWLSLPPDVLQNSG